MSERVPKNGRIGLSIEKWSNPGDYREKVESLRVSKNCPVEYRKRVESMLVPKNGRIRASTGKGRIPASIEKLFEREPKNGTISVSTGKWSNPGEYRERV